VNRSAFCPKEDMRKRAVDRGVDCYSHKGCDDQLTLPGRAQEQKLAAWGRNGDLGVSGRLQAGATNLIDTRVDRQRRISLLTV
jgi:hypothetical protein